LNLGDKIGGVTRMQDREFSSGNHGLAAAPAAVPEFYITAQKATTPEESDSNDRQAVHNRIWLYGEP